MIELSKRQYRLVQGMLSNQNYYTVKYYADLINISERTIHNDLKGIEKYLTQYELVLEKKPSVGIKIQGNIKNKLKAIKYLTSFNEKLVLEGLSPMDRRIKITKMLLIEEKILTYQWLSDYFLVSKSSIAIDVETICSYLNQYTVKIESNQKGTYISGTEMQVQYSLKLFNEKVFKKTGIVSKLSNVRRQLKDLYPVEIINISFKIVKVIEKKFTKPIGEHYLITLFNTIVVLSYRASLQKHHSSILNDYIIGNNDNVESFLIAKDSLETINSELAINFLLEDIIYLNQHLIAIGAEPNDHLASVKEEYITLIEDIIRKMSYMVKIDLTEDQDLFEGIMSHFIPMIYRLKSGIKIKNPLLAEIKEQYSVMLRVTWFVSSIIEEQLKVKLSEDEVAFMMIHFQASLERNRTSKKILIVCPTGIGTSELIANKVKRFLPAHYVLEVVPIRKVYQRSLENVEFIISAIPLEIEAKPVIHISSLVTNSDIKNITNFYTDLMLSEDYSIDEEKLPTIQYLTEFITEESIFIKKDMSGKDEILKYLIGKLKDNNDIIDGFEESVYTREELGTTALDTGVAIPHGVPKFVVNSKVFILTCETPVNWDGEKVDTIILICISEKDLKSVKNVLSEIYTLIETRKKVEKFLSGNTKEGILQMIRG